MLIISIGQKYLIFFVKILFKIILLIIKKIKSNVVFVYQKFKIYNLINFFNLIFYFNIHLISSYMIVSVKMRAKTPFKSQE